MARTNALEILGEAIMNWEHELDDVFTAVRAADSTAKWLRKDVCIMPDLRIMLPEHAKEAPLEVVKYIREGREIEW
jgi:hypothetical protein